jgi:hypothetical protein
MITQVFQTVDALIEEMETVRGSDKMFSGISSGQMVHYMESILEGVHSASFPVICFYMAWRTTWFGAEEIIPELPIDSVGRIEAISTEAGVVVCFEDEGDAALFRLGLTDD